MPPSPETRQFGMAGHGEEREAPSSSADQQTAPEIQLTPEQDKELLDLLEKASKAEKQNDLGTAGSLLQEYLDKIREIDSKKELGPSWQEQYKRQVDIMQRLGIVETLKSGELGIKGIDGREYPMPTREEVARRMEENRELVERKQEQGFTRLLLVPFGLKLNDLIEAYKKSILEHKTANKLFSAKKDPSEDPVPLELDENQPVWVWDKYKDADVNGELIYQPKEFSENHQGKTKQELLGEQGGWRIILLEDMPNIPRENPETKAGRTQIDTKGTSIKAYMEEGENTPSPAEYLTAFQQDPAYKGEQGTFPEDQTMYAITHLEETDQVIDDYQGNGSISYQIGAYFPVSGGVPRAFWYRGSRRANLGGYDPAYRNDYCGVRPAVRI